MYATYTDIHIKNSINRSYDFIVVFIYMVKR